jgi:hypothetical protein
VGLTITWQPILFTKLRETSKYVRTVGKNKFIREGVLPKLCLSTIKEVPTLEKRFLNFSHLLFCQEENNKTHTYLLVKILTKLR